MLAGQKGAAVGYRVFILRESIEWALSNKPHDLSTEVPFIYISIKWNLWCVVYV